MQSKINSFFKPSSSSSSSSMLTERSNSPPQFCGDENDELAIWEKTQHTIVNTYTRRASEFERIDNKEEASDEKSEKPISGNMLSREECGSNGRNLKKKKRSYAQFHLELGQSNFLLHDCSTCGVKYSPGDEADEKNHTVFHKNFTLGIQFKGWRNERVVHTPNGERGRVILVLDSDPVAQRNKVQEVVKMMEMEMELGEGWIFHKLCRVYLFILSQRIAGCVVAESIKEAFEVLSCSIGATTKQARPKSGKLRFGDIVLQREVINIAPSEVSHESRNGAILCKKEAMSAVCGIRAIWVTPDNRRKGIATQMLDAVRESFCRGHVIEKAELAFSEPSSDGEALAANYTGTTSFSVYKTGNLCG
ncbi:protein CHROMOSOME TRANSMISSION FIDELITY 7-like [Hibiscus syriacus]|uniref:protein CHROMOSOME TRANSMISSION FIDELITY 7-like n=1 Tax=Hibiscus syriacus TaxID=106335 RepID=UPI0019231703|nr:protein CHROMOSOME TRANSMISSION FIDELITY 7-like [Hibiscus syriacus]